MVSSSVQPEYLSHGSSQDPIRFINVVTEGPQEFVMFLHFLADIDRNRFEIRDLFAKGIN